MVIKIVRLFVPSVGITLSILFFSAKDYDWKEIFMIFGLTFFLNWIADKFILEKFVGYKEKNIKK